MKHLLNDLSGEERNKILEQYNNSLIVETSKFNKLLKSKLGNVKPLLNEQVDNNMISQMMDQGNQTYSGYDYTTGKLVQTKAEKNITNFAKNNIDILNSSMIKAKKWWKDYLNNENVLAKFIKLNNLSVNKAKWYYSNYFYILDIIKFETYSKQTAKRADVLNNYAYVLCESNVININIDLIFTKNEDGIVQTFIHETQHLLYCFKPLTPEKNITNFKASDDCFNKNKAIYDNTKISKEDKLKELIIKYKDKIAKDLGVSSNDVLKKIEPFVDTAYGSWEKNYILGNSSELQSRLMAIRKHFNKNDLTKEDFVNYILSFKQETSNGNVDYIIAHWVLNEFKRSLGDFVNYLNTQFVKSDGIKTKQSPMDLPYKPKEGLV